MAGKSDAVPKDPFCILPVLSSEMSLLPPSYFMAAKAVSKTEGAEEDEYQRDLQELQALREENKKLRALLPECPKEHREVPYAGSCNTVPLAEHVRMKAQFQECIDLLKTENSAHSEKILHLEKLRIKEKEEFECRKHECIAALEATQESLVEEVQRLQDEREQVAREKDDEMLQLRATMDEERQAVANRLGQMEHLLAERDKVIVESQQRKEETVERLNEELSFLKNQILSKDQEILSLAAKASDEKRSHDLHMKDCLQLIAGFRAYLGMESPPDGDFTWKRERAFLLAQNGSLQQENLALCKEVKLVNTRLGAMSQILALQESELSQSSCTPREVGLQRSHKSQDHPASLLTRWREKVFALLVQMKSNELLQQESLRHFAHEKSDLTEKINHLQRDRDLLECSLEDRTAQLGIEQERSKTLENRITGLVVQCSATAEKNQNLQGLLDSLSALIRQFPVVAGQHKEALSHLLARLVGYERRLDFAHKRIQTFQVLHPQTSPTEEGSSLRTICTSTQTEQESHVLSDEEDLKSLSKDELVTELLQVMKERDQVIGRINMLTEEFAEKSRLSRQQFESELVTLQQLLQCAQEERDLLSSKCEEMMTKLSVVEQSNHNLTSECGCLRAEVADLRANLEEGIERAVLEEREKSQEEFAKMERHLNEARREHSKIAVALQQTKRDAVRERERLVQALELEREHLEAELDACKGKLLSITAERNLLATAVQRAHEVKSTLPEVTRPPPRPLVLPQSETDGEDVSSIDGTTSLEGSGGTYILNRGSNCSDEDPWMGNEPSLIPADSVSTTGHTGEAKPQDLYTALQELQQLSTDILRLEGKQ
jgi:coiled-coil alpha-helical rod protein 1